MSIGFSSEKKLGEGPFGYVFEVRPEKEDEAKEIREEWRNKDVEEHIPSKDKSSSLSDIEVDSNTDNSKDDDAFLAKNDDDGNFIG